MARGALGVEQPELVVGAGGGQFHGGQPADQVHVGGQRLAGDGEVLHGAEGVDAPVGVGGDVPVAQEVVFGAEVCAFVERGHGGPYRASGALEVVAGKRGNRRPAAARRAGRRRAQVPRRCPPRVTVSTSSAASSAHGDGHPGAVSAVGDLHGDGAAVRQSHQLDAFEAVLGQQAGHQAHQRGDIPVLARDHLRVAAHGARRRRLPRCRVPSAEASRPKARAMPRRVRAKSGVPQPSVLCAPVPRRSGPRRSGPRAAAAGAPGPGSPGPASR